MAYREDIGTLARAKRLDNGRLIVDATFTRSGVFDYLNPDGTIRSEYRPESEVFAQKSMDSLALVPFTDLHPPVMVTASNAGEYTKGQVGEVIRRDGRHLVGKIAINDAATIAKMDGGEAELSCGYECVLVMGAGVSPDGVPYHATQTLIEYNHVARVPAGRAETARARMDERLQRVARTDAAMQISDISTSAALSASPDFRVRTDSTTQEMKMDLTQALAALAAANEKIGAANARADAAEQKAEKNKKERQDMEQKLTVAESALVAEKTRADTAEKLRTDAEKLRTDAASKFDAQVIERSTLIASAIGSLGRNDKGEILSPDGKSTIKLDALPNRDIQVAIVAKLDGVTIPAERSDETVKFVCDAALERAAKAGKALGDARTAIVTANFDAKAPSAPGDLEEAARVRMDERRKNMHKTTGVHSEETK